MAKNIMPEVAKMLGVELGEEFIIENAEHNLQVVLAADGLHISAGDYFGRPNGFLLQKVLCGLFEVKKRAWEPKYRETFYYPCVSQKMVLQTYWLNGTRDYALKALGMIYRTRKEAEAHLAEDYERLIGKPLSSR